MADFKWTAKSNAGAVALAEGKTQQAVADEVGVSRRTIERWMSDMDFRAEVDRLSLMTGISSRAERLRIAKRVIRQRIDDVTGVETEKDILDWLKFAQSETDGIKLDLSKLAALGTDDPPVAD